MRSADPCGRLVLVVGPSGAGKDTLIDHARERFRSDPGFRFVRRVITRPASAGEDHEPVEAQEFLRRAEAGAFALSWHAHELSYGIPVIVDEWLGQGRVVIANGSRGILPEARRRYRSLLVANVTAPTEILARRLSGRGRESEASVRRRLARSDLHAVEGEDVLHIDNSGPPDLAGEHLVKALLACRGAAGPEPMT